MLSIERAQAFHDRACRGDSLTSEERQVLDEWYASMDAAEGRLLSGASAASSDEGPLGEQIRESLARLESITAKTREIEQSNEELRHQNEELIRFLKTKGVLAA